MQMQQIRCTSLLTVPAFLGRAGRGFLKALILGYVITGPIFNLTLNGKEVVRTFVCSAELTYNLTKTRVDLMFKPFQKVRILILFISSAKKCINKIF